VRTGDLASILAGRTGAAGVEACVADAPTEALELLTVDSEGWPHAAWLGPGEVLVEGPDTLKLAIWPNSTTSLNLSASGRALLQFVGGGDPRELVKVRLRVVYLGRLDVEERELAAYRATLDDLRVDGVTYADVTAGLSYVLKEHESVIARWRTQLTAL
jgi:hypothetical protein